MRETINNYVTMLNKHRQHYGLHAIILYQIGMFYYIFSNNENEMEDIKKIINLPWSKKRNKDEYYRCWIDEEKLHSYVKQLTDNDFTCIIYQLNTRLCIHNRRERECKLCGNVQYSHLLFDIVPSKLDTEYVIV